MTESTANQTDFEPSTQNAWVHFSDSPDGEEYAAWVELLGNDRNRKGLVKIGIEYHAGRSGYKEIAEVGTADEKGKAPTHSTYAHLDASHTARQAFEVATKDHKRHARVIYRMQLWHAGSKRNEQERRGDYATIRFDGGTGDAGAVSGMADGGTMKVIRDMLQDARNFALKMADAQIQMAQAASGTSLFGLQMVDEMARRKSELADYAAAVRMAPSAEDVTRRIESVMSRVEGPLNTFASAAAPKIHQWATGGDPKAAPYQAPPDPGQAQKRAQDFFGSMSAEQCDQVRDLLGPDNFAGLAELIKGAPEQWARGKKDIKPALLPHLAALKTILTPEQFAALIGI